MDPVADRLDLAAGQGKGRADQPWALLDICGASGPPVRAFADSRRRPSRRRATRGVRLLPRRSEGAHPRGPGQGCTRRERGAHGLYWHVGRDILARQEQEGWGARVIDRLSTDLHAAFPEMKGFSPRNLKYMRAFAEAWPEPEFVQQVAAQLPWFHSCTLLDRVKDGAVREWYAR